MKISPYAYPGIMPEKQATSNGILTLICQKLNVREQDVVSESQKGEFVTARKYYSIISRACLNKELKDIGKDLGGRDHSTIINSINKIKDIFQAYPVEYEEFRKFANSINYKWGAILDHYISKK